LQKPILARASRRLTMGVIVSERLVNDRWGEFQRLARIRGGLPSASAAPFEGDLETGSAKEVKGRSKLLKNVDVALAEEKVGAGNFMREFFDVVSQVQGTLKQGREGVQRMDALVEDALQATTQDRQREVSEALQQLSDVTTGHIAASKRGLELLKERAEKEDKERPSAAEHRIRQNMQQAMAKKHQQLLLDFQKAQVDFKNVLMRRQAKEMQLMCPDASAEEIADMMEAGQTSSQMVMRRMAGAHAMITEEVERIRDKHQDILRLEASIQDLAQMFQEIAVLVEAQGEMLDCIETNVQNTKEYTGGGVKQLDKTLKIQHNTRKWQCYLSCFCMTLLLVILGPVLIQMH